jgi:hypothetical protein
VWALQMVDLGIVPKINTGTPPAMQAPLHLGSQVPGPWVLGVDPHGVTPPASRLSRFVTQVPGPGPFRLQQQPGTVSTLVVVTVLP